MYVATMEYPLAAGTPPVAAAQIWKSVVEPAARGREGLVRLQLLSRPGTLLAVGTWEDKRFAEAFMQTGVFLLLKDALEGHLAGDPQPRLWDQEVLISR